MTTDVSPSSVVGPLPAAALPELGSPELAKALRQEDLAAVMEALAFGVLVAPVLVSDDEPAPQGFSQRCLDTITTCVCSLRRRPSANSWAMT